MLRQQRARTGINRYDDQNLKMVRKHRPDYMILILSLLMLTAGLIVMYAISPALAAQGGNVGDNYFVARQFVAILLGVGVFFLVSKINLNKWQQWSKILLVIVLAASLVAVFDGGGKEGLRWIQFGFFSFQPVEFLKFVVIISLAGYLSSLQNSGRISDFKSLKPVLGISAIVAIVVVIMQRDLGSAVVLACIVGAMIFSAGFPMKKLLLLAAVALTLIVLAISSTPYRRDRLMTFMNPERDCQNDGYHACQALIAVGSGGLVGLGLGRSVQAYGYLPEAENDSIFAIFAEKFGFLGVIILISILGALLLRLLNIMQRAPNSYAQLIVAGVFTWLAVQSFINIAAMVGLIPLKGITLPFISYGGTSLVFAMAALGLVFNISYYTSIREPISLKKESLEKVNRRNSAFGSRIA